MSKLEESLKSESLEKLKAMQVELKQKVESNSLSFGTRAKNVLKAVLIGAGVVVGIATTKSLSAGKEARDAYNGALETYRQKHPDKSDYRSIVDFAKTGAPEVEAIGGSRNFKIAARIVSIGAIIGSAIALNKDSKRKQSEKLGFVEQELARREAVMQGVAGPQK